MALEFGSVRMISWPCVSSSASTKAQALSSALLVKVLRVSTFFTTFPMTCVMKSVMHLRWPTHCIG
eukprot:6633835-Lingulodinium_polyedra.AAC.1